jgi:hypothetical protein
MYSGMRSLALTGDASMYYSTGGGTLGEVTVPAVHAEAIRVVKVFGDLVELLSPVDLVEAPLWVRRPIDVRRRCQPSATYLLEARSAERLRRAV